MKQITIDKKSRFYRNCKRQRRDSAKICSDCPFRELIEDMEGAESTTKKKPDRFERIYRLVSAISPYNPSNR